MAGRRLLIITGRYICNKKAVEGLLRRLHTDYIDLYYQHRADLQVPIEEGTAWRSENY